MAITKVDFSTVLKDLHGNALERIKTPARTKFVDGREVMIEGPVLEQMTARHAAIDALMASDANEKDGVTKMKAFRLALSVSCGNEVELTAEDVVLLKRKIAESWAPLVCGRLYELMGE